MLPPLPLAQRLSPTLSPVDAWRRLASLGGVVFFDSAAATSHGRYSFVCADPFDWIRSPGDARKGLDSLREQLSAYGTTTRIDLPPFQGGAAGLLGYELGRSLEAIPPARINDLPTPSLALGLYDVVVAFDQKKGESWLVSQGFPETDPALRRARAAARLEYFARMLEDASVDETPWPPLDDAPCAVGRLNRAPQLDAPQYEVGIEGVVSNFSAEGYCEMVRAGVELIHAGELFQVNLAQRLLCKAFDHPANLYLRLRARNPAPYAGYFDLGDIQVCSASPECFLTLRDGWVETRPIKGTRGRSLRPEADLFAGDALASSEKDRAENVMIVDLMRNDLSRVCEPHSVQVAQLCGVETYAFVKHLVSSVRGRLRDGLTSVDLACACFPGGSITGAPKIRAMQAISELERTARGAYCGSLAYFGFDGQMDASILIRTITVSQGWLQLPVGGGIVAQSQPEDEYRETWHKARGMLAALR